MTAPTTNPGREAEGGVEADVVAIAAKLTEAQRRALVSGISSGPGCWPLRNALARKGLAQAMPFRRTMLGLKVAAYVVDLP